MTRGDRRDHRTRGGAGRDPRRSSPTSSRGRGRSSSRARPGSARRSSGRLGSRTREAAVARVLACRGAEAEASLSFAGLSELVDARSSTRSRPRLLPPRRRALEVALLLAEPGDAAPDAHAIGLAVLDVLRALAAQRAGSRRGRRPAVARPVLRRRAADRAATSARRATSG